MISNRPSRRVAVNVRLPPAEGRNVMLKPLNSKRPFSFSLRPSSVKVAEYSPFAVNAALSIENVSRFGVHSTIRQRPLSEPDVQPAPVSASSIAATIALPGRLLQYNAGRTTGWRPPDGRERFFNSPIAMSRPSFVRRRTANIWNAPRQPPRMRASMDGPFSIKTITTPINEPPAMMPDATGKRYSSDCFFALRSSTQPIRPPRKNESA